MRPPFFFALQLSWEQVRARRLARSHLLERSGDLPRVVSDVCGLQAQIQAAAELGASARSPADVRAALWEERTLVRTYGPRDTIHVHAAADVPLWMAAMRARPARVGGKWLEHWASDGEELLDAFAAALDGRALTREELAAEVSPALASQWGSYQNVAAYAGLLCFGPPRGSKVTYVRADQWVAGWKELDPDESLREIARRFLSTYGPARPTDFSSWFGLPREQAQAVFGELALYEVDVEGRRTFVLAGDGSFPEPVRDSVRLTPQYDCYVMGFRERDALVAPEAREALKGKFEGAAGVSWLLLDGFGCGFWTRKRRGRAVDVAVEPFVPLTKTQRRGIEDEAERVADCLGGALSLLIR